MATVRGQKNGFELSTPTYSERETICSLDQASPLPTRIFLKTHQKNTTDWVAKNITYNV